MGYPIQIRIRPNHPLTFVLIVLILMIFPFSGDVTAKPPATAGGLPPGGWDHVIITVPSLVQSFTPLRQHRCRQGLSSRIITIAQAQAWSGFEDPIAAVRWTVAAAAQDWGTRYLLLGGDAEQVPVPLGRYDFTNYSWEIPMDLYYAAPHGEWDLDGDGILGEWGDDAPDLTPVVALGRAPVATRSEAAAFVAKVLDFEAATDSETHDVLLAAEVLYPYPWYPGMEVEWDFAREFAEFIEIMASWEAISDIDRLYENHEDSPAAIPLSLDSYLETLIHGEHRFLGQMGRGSVDSWSLGLDELSVPDLVDLEGMDHPIFAMAAVPGAADCREEGVLEAMLNLPVGGCVGAVAPSTPYFIFICSEFFQSFWQAVVDGGCPRVGDAYLKTLVDDLDFIIQTPPGQAFVQGLSIVGDPALLFLPASVSSRPKPEKNSHLTVEVSPNPFNAAAEISFSLPEGTGSLATTVEIFDLSGRRITRIVDSVLEPGRHSVFWQGVDDAGRRVASGIYFARCRAGDTEAVTKLLLVE